jgi:hypothetical protein
MPRHLKLASAARETGAAVIAYHAQVRYPSDVDWVTIDVSEDRRKAAALGSEAYRYLTNARGERATQVRVIGAPDLVREGGQDAANHVPRDLWQQHKPLVVEGN